MPAEAFIRQIREHIAANELPAALQQLRILLEHSPKLDEAILQSGRFHDIRKQIRLGMVSPTEAKLTQDEIREGLLDLLREVEESVGADFSQLIKKWQKFNLIYSKMIPITMLSKTASPFLIKNWEIHIEH